jgi:Heterogeneous nuclear ribonucleoprotein Q acidic domain
MDIVSMTTADDASGDLGLTSPFVESTPACEPLLPVDGTNPSDSNLNKIEGTEVQRSTIDQLTDTMLEKNDDVPRSNVDHRLNETIVFSAAVIDRDAAIQNTKNMSPIESNQVPSNQFAATTYSADDDDDDLFGDRDSDDREDNKGESVSTEIESIPTVNDAVAPTTLIDPPFENVFATDTSGEELKVEDSSSSVVSTTIPRKNSATGATVSGSPEVKKHTITYTTEILSSLGLPEGILVPFSVDKEKLLNNNPNNRKMMDTLRSLPVKLVNDALSEYDDAVQVKGTSIRNHGAYLYGVVKRYVAVQERSISGGDGTGILPMGETLTETVQARLEQLVNTGFCTRDEMNDKVKSKIKMLPEKDALFALDELSSVSRSQIRNFGSYFMGILNRYMRGDDEKNKGNSGQGIGGQNLYNSSSPSHHKYGPSVPPYLSQHQNSNPVSHFQQRGRDRNSAQQQHQGQHGNAFRNDRDRSRDRFSSSQNENRRFSQTQNGRERNFNLGAGDKPPYDNRLQAQQQMPTWQQNAQQQQQVGMAGYAPSNSTQSYPPMAQQQQQPQQYPFFQQQNSAQSNTPNHYQPQNLNSSNQLASSQNYSSNPLPPPATAGYGSQTSALVSSNPPYGVSSQQQQPYISPQNNQYQVSPVTQPSGPNAVYGRPNNPQQGTNMIIQQNPRSTASWQQQPTMHQLDIMGLADKAASAVQALQNRPSGGSVPTHSYPPQQQSQLYTSPPFQQQQQSMYGVVGGVQSLPNQYPIVAPQMQGQIMQQQYSSVTQQQGSNFLHATSQMSHTNQDSNRSRRTSASLGQLPHGVQYLIQVSVIYNFRSIYPKKNTHYITIIVFIRTLFQTNLLKDPLTTAFLEWYTTSQRTWQWLHFKNLLRSTNLP